eukprot:3933863-Lingulodinium_polyedra.AAC.1
MPKMLPPDSAHSASRTARMSSWVGASSWSLRRIVNDALVSALLHRAERGDPQPLTVLGLCLG